MVIGDIHIQWEGPHQVSQALGLTAPTDYGLYQVYGCHPVYGVGTLLYIGKARDQTFSTRLKQESWDDYADWEGKVTIYVGRLLGSETPSDARWNREIDCAEALLINAHKPAHNQVGIRYLSPRTDRAVREVHVFNWGDFASLLPEVTGHRWSSKADDISEYLPYGS